MARGAWHPEPHRWPRAGDNSGLWRLHSGEKRDR